MTSLSYAFRIGKPTVTKIIRQVCRVLWFTLKAIVLKQPGTQDWLEIAAQFEKNANFPNCIGAIDGKHVAIQVS